MVGAFRSYYITSFSANEDNLSMWGMYAANGNGCAIAFDYDMLTKRAHRIFLVDVGSCYPRERPALRMPG